MLDALHIADRNGFRCSSIPPEIETMILRQLGIEDLLKLFDDRVYQPRVIGELTRRFTMTLALFVPNPEEFRNIMRRFGALVGGSVALWFATS